jgi:hypothetical protein
MNDDANCSLCLHRPFDRGYEIRQRLRPAMLALRDAEDWVRLELRDEVLAERIRGVHEALTEDVLNGRSSRDTTRRRAQLWDRYCRIRGHNPDALARVHTRFLRSLGLRKVPA